MYINIIGSTTNNTSINFKFFLGELSLTNKENEKLTKKLTKMEENKIKAHNAYLEKVQKKFKLIPQIKKQEN